jgi:hypothetical protein
MLNIIASHIGGNVRTVNKDEFIIWVVNNKIHIQNIIKIFYKYPPITSRLRAQLAFMIESLEKNDLE